MDRQETCEIPHTSTCATCREGNAGRSSVPGLMGFLRTHQERFGDDEHRRRAWDLEPKP